MSSFVSLVLVLVKRLKFKFCDCPSCLASMNSQALPGRSSVGKSKESGSTRGDGSLTLHLGGADPLNYDRRFKMKETENAPWSVALWLCRVDTGQAQGYYSYSLGTRQHQLNPETNVFSGFWSKRITSRNCKRKHELASSSSRPTLESAQHLPERRRQQLGVTEFLLYSYSLTLSSRNCPAFLSHLGIQKVGLR